MTVDADGQITDLTVDDHACLTFCEGEELLDLTAAFVRDGLADGLKVVWLSDLAPTQALAELTQRGVAAGPATSAGQIVVAEGEGSLLRERTFRAEQAMSWLDDQMKIFRSQGYSGLRIAIDMSWALRPIVGVEELPGFEADVGAMLAGAQVSLLCQYDRDRFDPVTLASVAASHTRSVAAATYHHDAVLRICRQYAPPGLRLAGEIDHLGAEPLAMALQEAIRLDGDVTVNMANLSFIDTFCTRMIMDAVRSLAPARSATLRCSPEVTTRFVQLGALDTPGVSLVTVYER